MIENTVYLIDDEVDILEFLSDTVEMTGLTSKSYTRAALFFAENPTVPAGSILILDLNMPEMDGIEVMRRLSKMDAPPKLILVSGHDSGVLHAAEKLGIAHNLEIIATLNKPIPFATLKKILENHASAVTGTHQGASPLKDSDFTRQELLGAIIDRQMILHYQPQVDIATGMITGTEALVRWQHPQLGLIYPDRFISLTEEYGLMGELTELVTDKAVDQQQKWLNSGLRTGVSINISAQSISGLSLPEQLAGLLQRKQLDPGMLTLEVTENALMGELVTSLDILTRLRLKGISLSIDDFGTGYSSLSQLHRVPFTELKIDRSFVINMMEDLQARAIVKTCIMLGHELGMQVVAEGVETKKHLELLKKMGCNIAQGYYISRPEPPEKITDFLLKGRFDPKEG